MDFSLEEIDQLIEDCISGKREAQSKLYQVYSSRLLAVCVRYAHDRSDAEDSLHEAFMLIFKKIGQYSGRGSFEGWMKRIAINVAINRYNQQRRFHAVEDISSYESKMESAEMDTFLNAKQMLEMIAELPPMYRMVFNLYAIDGYSHKEIAEKLRISEGTSKSNLSRARQILQKKIEKFGIKDKMYAR